MFKKFKVSLMVIATLLLVTISGCASEAKSTVPTPTAPVVEPVVVPDPAPPKVLKPTKTDIVGAWFEKSDSGIIIFYGDVLKNVNAAYFRIAYTTDGKKETLDGFYDVQDKGNDVYLITLYKMVMPPWTPDVGEGNVAPPIKGAIINTLTTNFIDKDNIQIVYGRSTDISPFSRIKLEMAESMLDS